MIGYTISLPTTKNRVRNDEKSQLNNFKEKDFFYLTKDLFGVKKVWDQFHF